VVQAAGRDDLLRDPVVDDTRANAKLLGHLLYREFSRLLFVHGWNGMLVPDPGDAGTGEGIALVAGEPFGAALSECID